MLSRARAWLGESFMRVGLRLLGVTEAGKTLIEPEPDEEDEEEFEPVTWMPSVTLNDEARRMVQDGLTAQPHFKPPTEPAPHLAGSAQDRIARARAQNR